MVHCIDQNTPGPLANQKKKIDIIGPDIKRFIYNFIGFQKVSPEDQETRKQVNWKKAAIYLDRVFLAIYLSVTAALIIWILAMTRK